MLGATHTLLVLTSHRLARIDFVGRGRRMRTQQVTTCPAPPSGSLAASLALAWHSAKSSNSSTGFHRRNSAHRVWVASQDFFTEVMKLPLETTLMLGPEELDRAIALEAETYSGVSAFASNLQKYKLLDASSNSGDGPAWWVTQVSSADLETMTSVLAHLGATFQGATHPAMLQLLSRSGTVDAQAIQAAIADWQLDSTETLDGSDRFQENVRSLGEAFAAAEHQRELSRCMLGGMATTQLSRRVAWLQTSLACLAVFACGGHYWQQSHRLHELQQQANQSSQLVGQDKVTRQLLQTVQANIKSLRQQIADSTSRSEQLEKQRLVAHARSQPALGHWTALFDTLASHSSDDWWIESWESDAQNLTLHGWATSSDIAIELATQLSHALSDHACEVHLPKFVEQNGNVQFDLQISLPGQPKTSNGPATTTKAADNRQLNSFGAAVGYLVTDFNRQADRRRLWRCGS